MAMGMYFQDTRHMPRPAPPNGSGGWAIAIMPFMEEQFLADELAKTSSIDPEKLSPLARQRPVLLGCPSALEVESRIARIPAAHYVVIPTDKSRKSWQIGDAPKGFREPWIVSPELPPDYWHDYQGPHDRGFNLSRDGYVEGREP